MDKRLFINLQGGRKVSGILRGYDLFLNLVVEDAIEETNPAQKHPIGTTVRFHCPLSIFLTVSSPGRPREQCDIHGDTRGHPIVAVDAHVRTLPMFSNTV